MNHLFVKFAGAAVGIMSVVSPSVANVIVVGTGFGVPAEAIASKDQNDSGPQYSPDLAYPVYTSTTITNTECGVQKFKPTWGTLNSALVSGTQNLFWEVDLENNEGPGGRPPQGGGVNTSFDGSNVLFSDYSKQPNINIPTSGTLSAPISKNGDASDYTGYGVHHFPLSIVANATARGDHERTTADGTFYGVVSVKYTFSTPNPAGSNPGVPGDTPGDTDGDGDVDQTDITSQLTLSLGLDNDGDGNVDANDTTYLFDTILNTRPGDVNLDGKVNGTDLGIINAANPDGYGSPATYATGDLDGDGYFTEADADIFNTFFGWHR